MGNRISRKAPVLAAATIFVLLQGAVPKASAQLAPTASIRAQIVKEFTLKNSSVMEAIAKLGKVSNVPMGVVLSDQLLCDKKISFSSTDQSFGTILDKLIQGYGYSWQIDNGVVNLEPMKKSPQGARLLQLVVPRISMPKGTLDEQNMYLWLSVRGVLKPQEGTAMNILAPSGAKLYPELVLRESSVRDALNEMARRSPGIWIMFPLKEKLDSAADAPFSQVLGYTEIDGLVRIKCQRSDGLPR